MSAKDFQLLAKLGEGAFSNVWKARRLSDGQEYAMKIVKFTSLSEKEKQNAINEVRILASIKHPCVIGYKEAFFEDNPLSLCVVMEYAGGGDILNKINQHQKANTFFREEEIWRFSIQMIMGLKALHDMRILHRDLKCANVFLSTDGRTTKLGDLNVSKVAKDDLAYTQTGTPYYASPEVWRDEPYDLKSDIWSLGCVIYEMCAHKPPFRASDMPGLFKKIQRGVFDRIPSQYSIDLYNLISICLQVKPAMRPTCDQLLAHPIVQRNAGRYIQDIADTPGMESLNELLGTIRMPANIKALAQRLPKANYTPTPPPMELERGRPDSAQRRVNIQAKRPTSQSAPYSKIIPKVRESHSRDSKITHVIKADPIPPRETEREYLLRMQKEYIEKARAIKPMDILKDQKSPRHQPQENIKLQKSPNRPLSGRKLIDNQPTRERVDTRGSESGREEPVMSNMRTKSKALDMRRPTTSTEEAQRMETNMPLIRQRPLSREKRVEEIMPDKTILNRQEYLLNKYQTKNNNLTPKTEDPKIVLPRVMSEKDHVLIRRADYLLEKYQSSDSVKRDPVVAGGGEVKRPIITPSKGTRREVTDIMEKYANILNMKEGGKIVSNEHKERPLGRRKVEGNPGEQHNINLYTPKRNMPVNNENKSSNANLIKQQARMKVDARPLNWG